jgi:peptidoglycan/LPS O-acetylase OafA/YrhL
MTVRDAVRAAAPSPSAGGRAGHLVGLDGVRGAAAILVVFAHTLGMYAPATLISVHGDFAAEVIVTFFCLSGFLIFLPFARRIIDRRDVPSIGDYARSRILRIYPASIVILLAADLAGALIVTNDVHGDVGQGTADTGSITDPLRVLLHLSLLQNLVPSQLQTGIPPTWSLTTELCFYASMPLMAWIAGRVARARPGWSSTLIAAAPGALLVVVGVVTRGVVEVLAQRDGLSLLESQWAPNPVAVLARSILGWSDDFGLGMIAVVLFLAIRRGDLAVRRGPLAVVLLAVIAVSLVTGAATFKPASWLLPTAIGIASSALLLLITASPPGAAPGRLGRILDVLPLRYVGLVSLSVYLWHFPVLLIMHRLGWSRPDAPLGALEDVGVVLGVSLALASATYWLVERPFQRLGARWRSHAHAG